MIWIFLGFLFILQIIGFYFLALLYTKLSQFDGLEKKQRKLMEEMDNSIAAYLSELKDENERLIEQLRVRERETDVKKVKHEHRPSVEEAAATVEQTQPMQRVNKSTIPVNVALKSYHAASSAQDVKLDKPEVVEEEDDRALAFTLHDAGQSVEEIAKRLGKGRTEVELILKFR